MKVRPIEQYGRAVRHILVMYSVNYMIAYKHNSPAKEYEI